MDLLTKTPPRRLPPSEAQKRRVERLAQIGSTEQDIATELGISVKSLQRQFRRELQRGSAIGKHHVLETLFEQAQSGSNMTAVSLWGKVICAWRDTGPARTPSTALNPIVKFVTSPKWPTPHQN